MRIFKPISILLCVLVIGLSACAAGGSASPTPLGANGIEGYVTEGPTCPGPVRIGDTECANKPYQATISVLSAGGKQVIQFQTDIDGYFKVALAPGTYILHPESSTPMPRAGDQTVAVSEGQYTRADIVYDTGMR